MSDLEDATESSGVPWRQFHDEALRRLIEAGGEFIESSVVDARRIVEQAAGFEPAEFVIRLDEPARKRGVAHFDAMLERRLAGEPLQYVLGNWGFRTLDLAVDRRVLIPRPETEGVVGLALAELARVTDRTPLAADLGTGSGAIGLSLVAEHPKVQVICTDVSTDAVAAARANACGLGRPSSRIEVREGSWFDALPAERLGEFDVIVSNPPYVAEDEELPAVVADWEPRLALVAGPSGLESAELLIDGAFGWVRPGGALVLELGATQLTKAAELARTRGWTAVEVHQDLAGHDRALLARRP